MPSLRRCFSPLLMAFCRALYAQVSADIFAISLLSPFHFMFAFRYTAACHMLAFADCRCQRLFSYYHFDAAYAIIALLAFAFV